MGRTAARRLDIVVVEAGLAETRARAQELIIGGAVLVDGNPVTRPGATVRPEAKLALARAPLRYVSRGGLKLEGALESFPVSIENRVAIDVGASTGGFTDLLLQRGAARVYAVDVGYGQLAWTLRNNPRVVVMERTNIRHLDSLPEAPDLMVADVSFISLRLVLPAVQRLMAPVSDAIVLIKPQFEAGRSRVGKKGVVRDPAVWRDVLLEVLRFAVDQGWGVAGLAVSPIKGPSGNVEFLAHLTWGRGESAIDIDSEVERMVAAATAL